MTASRKHTLIAAAWGVLLALLVAHAYLTYYTGAVSSTLYLNVVVTQSVRVLVWAALTPLVFAAARRWRLVPAPAWRTIGAHLAFCLLASGLNSCARALAFAGLRGWAALDRGMFSTFLAGAFVDMAIYAGLVGFITGLRLLEERRELELRQRDLLINQVRLESAVVEAELRAIKQQLQPHFLFNALNSVSTLVRQSRGPEAVETLAQISRLLRTLLENAREQQVSFARELEFTQCYLEIEQARFREKLVVRYFVDDEALPVSVPSLLLQPLVENAVKHGIARRSEPGVIEITASCRDGRLHLSVCNDLPEAWTPPAAGSQVGLEATRERLRRFYGDGCSMLCRFEQARGAEVALVLPLAAPTSPATA